MLNIKKLLLIPVVAIMCMFTRIDSGFAVAVSGVDYPFSVTISISSGGAFYFQVYPKGTFYVDCGTDGTLGGYDSSAAKWVSSDGTTLNKTRYGSGSTFKCTYSSTGTKTIRFGGVATQYSTSTSETSIGFKRAGTTNASLITSISGNLSAVFPYISATNNNYPKFNETFAGATNLTSIPDNLFSNITVGGSYMFNATFYGCTGLTSIPANLFSNITNVKGNMFYQTFRGCTNLTGYVPATLFSGLIANGSGCATSMMGNIFYNTGLSTSCPSNKKQYITGYEPYWGRKVSCGDPITCPSGTYLPAGSTTCASCSSGVNCPGGVYGLNAKSDQGQGGTVNLNWYDNGTQISGGVSSCTVGDTFVLPPTPSARTGYVFVGWRIKPKEKCGIDQLDTTLNYTTSCSMPISGDAPSCSSKYGLTIPGQWAIKYSYGVVYGMSMCSSTAGSTQVFVTPAVSSGTYCYCQVTGFSPSGSDFTQGPQCTTSTSSLWWYQGNNNCAKNCAGFCASSLRSTLEYRENAFTAAGL